MLFLIKEKLEEGTYIISESAFDFRNDKDAMLKYIVSVLNYIEESITDKYLLFYFDTYKKWLSEFQYNKVSYPLKSEELFLMRGPLIQPVSFVFYDSAKINDNLKKYKGCICIEKQANAFAELVNQLNYMKIDNNKDYTKTGELNKDSIPIEIANLFNFLKGNLEWLLNCYSVRNHKLQCFDEIEIENHFRIMEQLKIRAVNRLKNLQEEK
ncbi:hypothetical protein [Lacrimispora amygdalina]|uniref:hypothetical protein n=1 Tax=Lacrimispora amygdalina TaxID=253257 RepID=UPI000BE25365|nr:hypothetical protein [Lacrimispora amygdalina]